MLQGQKVTVTDAKGWFYSKWAHVVVVESEFDILTKHELTHKEVPNNTTFLFNKIDGKFIYVPKTEKEPTALAVSITPFQEKVKAATSASDGGVRVIVKEGIVKDQVRFDEIFEVENTPSTELGVCSAETKSKFDLKVCVCGSPVTCTCNAELVQIKGNFYWAKKVAA